MLVVNVEKNNGNKSQLFSFLQRKKLQEKSFAKMNNEYIDVNRGRRVETGLFTLSTVGLSRNALGN